MRLVNLLSSISLATVLFGTAAFSANEQEEKCESKPSVLTNVKGCILGTALNVFQMQEGVYVLCKASSHRCIIWYDDSSCVTVDPDGHGIGAQDIETAFGFPEYQGEEYNSEGEVIGSSYLIYTQQ